MKIKQYKLKTRNKGGGNTVQSIPDWARPYIEGVAQTTQGAYSTGQLARTAGTNPLLDAAFGSGSRAIADTTNRSIGQSAGATGRLTQMAQEGAYDPAALKDKAILEAGMRTAELGKAYGSRGTLGSARMAVEKGAQDAATSAQFATIDKDMASENFQQKMQAEQAALGAAGAGQQAATGAAQAFSNLGDQARRISQEQLDTPWTAIQRYASTIYGNPARQQQASGGK